MGVHYVAHTIAVDADKSKEKNVKINCFQIGTRIICGYQSLCDIFYYKRVRARDGRNMTYICLRTLSSLLFLSFRLEFLHFHRRAFISHDIEKYTRLNVVIILLHTTVNHVFAYYRHRTSLRRRTGCMRGVRRAMIWFDLFFSSSEIPKRYKPRREW